MFENSSTLTVSLQEYPKRVWYILTGAIALATVINILSAFWRFTRVRGGPSVAKTWSPSVRARGPSLRRIPAAMLTASRILAFRWRILMGTSYSMSLLEAFITLVYLAILLIHDFVHSMQILILNKPSQLIPSHTYSAQNLDPLFWSNRAGHIAASQIPLLPALSSKNNIIGCG
jgi:ferric-chelate reductase